MHDGGHHPGGWHEKRVVYRQACLLVTAVMNATTPGRSFRCFVSYTTFSLRQPEY